jgi:hypothetical protein
MGEYGWNEIEHKGRRDRFLFPRQAGSLYHTTKVLETDLLWFNVWVHGLRVTDLMQGPVYRISTDEADLDQRLMPNFHYDDIFGTVVNRFLVQAVRCVAASMGLPVKVRHTTIRARRWRSITITRRIMDCWSSDWSRTL